MSETLTLRAADLYGSLLTDVTPSKVQRLERVASHRILYGSIRLKATIQQEWNRLSATQFIEGSKSSTPEPDEDLWQAVWLTHKTHLRKAPQSTRQQISRLGTWEPSENDAIAAWLTAKSLSWKPSGVSRLRDMLIQHTSDTDLNVSFEKFRISNLAGLSHPPKQEPELTPDEKRYHELTEKYFDGTLTQEEQVDLAQLREALDEADAKDPQLMELNQNLTAGYDRLQTGLRQVNRILDELLDTVSREE